MKECNTKLSRAPNTYDKSRNDTNTTPTATQLQNLNHNHPLSIVPQNFRNIALTDLITSRSNYPQSPIQHIITQQPKIEDTFNQIVEHPHHIPLIFVLRTTIFSAHSEPPSWIPPSIDSPPSQPPDQPPHHPTFSFPPPQSPQHNTSSSMESDTNSNRTVYNTISQFNNSDIETPDKFANSEPSPSLFSQLPFQPIHSQDKTETPSPPSPISYVTPIYSAPTFERSDNNDSEHTQISTNLIAS